MKRIIFSLLGIVLIIFLGGYFIIDKFTPKIIIEQVLIYGKNLVITGRVEQAKNIDMMTMTIGDKTITLEHYTRNGYLVFENSNVNENSIMVLDDLNIGEYNISFALNSKNYEADNELTENIFNYTSITKDNLRKDYEIVIDDNLIKVTNSLKHNIYDIIIDPGHSLDEAPAIKDDINEAIMVLRISKLVKQYLEDGGYKVKLSREDDKSPNNQTDPYGTNSRTGIAYETKSKYLFSIHLNSSYDEMTWGGVEIYSHRDIDSKLASSLADSIVKETGTAYSQKTSQKIAQGVYYRNFTSDEVERNYSSSIMSGYPAYESLSTDTPYYYIIRETGGIYGRAYVDGRNTSYNANPYRYSYSGTESYLLELGYLTYKDDYNNILNNYENYAKGIAQGIIEYLK